MSSIVQLRRVETDAGTSTLLAQDAAAWSQHGGVQLHHNMHWRGYAPKIEEIFLSAEEMDMLMAWWAKQQEKR